MKPIHDLEIKNMLRMANDARDRAYVPYSGFRVGACIKGETGAYYLGCNVENVSYGATNCAERTALFKAIYEGERAFDALAIVSTATILQCLAAYAGNRCPNSATTICP